MNDAVIEYTGPCKVKTLLENNYLIGEIFAEPHPSPQYAGRMFAVVPCQGLTEPEHAAAVQRVLCENTVYAKRPPIREEHAILRSLGRLAASTGKKPRGRRPKEKVN